jgi:nucleoside-diphosphate-sugar epimerase
MKNQSIGITGHKGVIGSEFLKEYKNNKFLKCQIDITNRKKVFNWIKNIDFNIFIHFAAIVPVNQVTNNKQKAYDVNFAGTKNIVDAIIKYKKKQKIWFFFSSTSHVYSLVKNLNKLKENSKKKPINYYGKLKYDAEKYIIKNLRDNNIKYCIGRIFSFTHYKQNKDYFVPSVFNKIMSPKKNIVFKNVNIYRDFIHLKDLLKSIKILFKNNAVGIFNIGSGNKVSLIEIINTVSKYNKTKKNIKIEKNYLGGNLIANISKLKKIKFKTKFDIYKIIKDYYVKKYRN